MRKRIISTILAAIMCTSVISATALANDSDTEFEKSVVVKILDTFNSSTDDCDWEVKKAPGASWWNNFVDGSAKNDGTWYATLNMNQAYIEKSADIDLTKGKTVLEFKFKATKANEWCRFGFYYNIPEISDITTLKDTIASNKLFRVSDYVYVNNSGNGDAKYYEKVEGCEPDGNMPTLDTTGFYSVKAVFEDGKITYYVTAPNGKVYGRGDAKYTAKSITNFAIAADRDNGIDVYIDDFKVTQYIKTKAEIDGKYSEASGINVVFANGADLDIDFSKYIDIYDGNELIAAKKVYTKKTGSVNLMPEEKLESAEEKYSVKIDIDGIEDELIDYDGEEAELPFSTYIPPQPPIVVDSDVKIIGNGTSGRKLTGSYKYFDINDDEEGDSIYQWYYTNADGTKIDDPISGADEITYTPDETEEGSYIMFSVIPVSKEDPNDYENVYYSAPVLIQNLYASTNLITNGDVEEGISGWTNIYGTDKETQIVLETNSDIVEFGENCIYVKGYNEKQYNWGSPNAEVDTGKTYIAAMQVYSPNQDLEGAKIGSLAGNFSLSLPYLSKEATTIKKGEWTLLVNTVKVSEIKDYNGHRRIAVVQASPYAEIYVDNAYMAEAVISGIGIKVSENNIVIPENGTKEVTVEVTGVLNQLGTPHGLYDETATLELKNDVPGVEFDAKTGKLTISDRATAGTVEFTAVCVPKDEEAEVFEETVGIELLPNSNVKPIIENQIIKGSTDENNVLEVSYDYYQVEGSKDVSTYRWLYSEKEKGEYKEIPNATAKTYKVEKDYAGTFIQLEITPKSQNGEENEIIYTNILGKGELPTAENITITGDMFIGEVLKADYKFTDKNNDDEGTSTYRWLASDSENGTYTAITGATAKEFTLTEKEVDKYIKFEVTPIAVNPPNSDTNVYLSKAYKGPSTPEAKDLKIVVDGKKVRGEYTYYHEYDIKESESIYEWTVDGKVVSDEISTILSFTGTKEVTFTVTPVCEKSPEKGKSVSVTRNITIKSSSNSGNNTTGISNNNIVWIPPEVEIIPTVNPPEVVEPTEHWSKAYCDNMSERGIMTIGENYEEFVTRANMVKYIALTIGLEKEEYDGMFADVTADDDYAGYLTACVNAGIISKDRIFRPNDNISREELCKVLYIALDIKGKINIENTVDKSKFADYETISDWAKAYVDGILDMGLMVGVSETEFSPKTYSTNAQIATVLTRILEMIGE